MSSNEQTSNPSPADVFRQAAERQAQERGLREATAAAASDAQALRDDAHRKGLLAAFQEVSDRLTRERAPRAM